MKHNIIAKAVNVVRSIVTLYVIIGFCALMTLAAGAAYWYDTHTIDVTVKHDWIMYRQFEATTPLTERHVATERQFGPTWFYLWIVKYDDQK